MHLEYATQIACDWDVKHSEDHRGYVTRFSVRTAFLERYEVHTLGGYEHQEYWIPAEDLGAFNSNIVGLIEVIAEFPAELNQK